MTAHLRKKCNYGIGYIIFVKKTQFGVQKRNIYVILIYFVIVLGKILNREVILPLFHCYIGEPASCLLDVLFDPIQASPLNYLEHSFLDSTSLEVPQACVISLSSIQRRMLEIKDEEVLLEDLVGFLAKYGNCTVLQVEFPPSGKDGFHLALTGFTDR
jgi:hypothetical protein